MQTYRHFAWPALAALLAACGAGEGKAGPGPASPLARDPVGYICDAVDAPLIYVVSGPDAAGVVTLRVFDKGAAEFIGEHRLQTRETEGAVGAVVTTYSEGRAPYGTMRALSADVLNDPSEAYTAPVAEMAIADRSVACRWLARTRLIGFTTRRSIIIAEDQDGDLIYRSFDFAGSQALRRIDLDDAQRTTAFSVEVRGGAEETGPTGSTYRFERDGFTYSVTAPQTGDAILGVQRAGAPLQNETLLAYQTPPDME